MSWPYSDEDIHSSRRRDRLYIFCCKLRVDVTITGDNTVLWGGQGSSSGKAFGYGLDGPGSIPGVGGGGDFSSLLRVQTGPGSTRSLIK